MRLLNATIPVTPKFDVSKDTGLLIDSHKVINGVSVYRPHLRLGWPWDSRSPRNVLLGTRYLTMVSSSVQCERESEAIFGICPKCHADVSGDRIRQVEETVSGFFKTVREVGKHDPYRTVNPIFRGLFYLTKDKETPMVVEERKSDENDLGMVLKVFGCKVLVDVTTQNPEYKKLADKVTGEYRHGTNLFAVDKMLGLCNGDRVRVHRTLVSGREEEIMIEVKAQYPRVISAKVLKDPAKTTVVPVSKVDEAAAANEVAEEISKRLEKSEDSKPMEVEPSPGMVPPAVEAPKSADPVLEETISKIVTDIDEASSSVDVDSIKQMFRHVNDLHRINRIREVVGQEVGSEDLIKILVEPIKTMAGLPRMPEHEGRQSIFRFGKGMKLVGNVIETGLLHIKTLYGVGNPVDKERMSIDITPKQ